MFSDVLSEKYTNEKIEKALSQWKDSSKNEPKLKSIESRLINRKNSNDTNIVIYRKYSIYKNITFPNHYYLTINDKIWHPGFGDDANIFQSSTSNNVEESNTYSIIEIKEKCNYCVYWELYRNFLSDRNFNVAINNCQIIIGVFAETICIIIICISTIIAALSGHYIFLLICLYFVMVLFVFSFSTYRTNSYKFSTCPHIIPIRKY